MTHTKRQPNEKLLLLGQTNECVILSFIKAKDRRKNLFKFHLFVLAKCGTIVIDQCELSV